MNSNYSTKHHIAVPTLDYIKEITGFDLLDEELSKEKAESKVLSLTLKAKDYLFSTKPAKTQKALSYMIFKYPNWLEAWENYVVRYIDATFYFDDFMTNPPQTVKDAINGSLLKVHFFTGSVYSEVEITTEVY